MKIQGEFITLTPEQEEACNWWAQVIGSEFAEKPIVLKNFEETLLGMLDPKHGVKALADLDFTPIKTYLEQVREERKNRPIEDRKRE